MQELITTNPNPAVIDSREVAAMVEKEHKNLMADIRIYIGYLTTENAAATEDELKFQPISLDPQEFFIESTYQDSYDREKPCYLCTKKGCELIANKLTGAKGVRFTAAYVQKFNQMEQTGLSLSGLSPQLQLLIGLEVEQKRQAAALAATNERLDNIGDLIALNPAQWRREVPHLVAKIAQRMGGYEHIQHVWEEAYKLLDDRAGCSVQTRLTNLRQRMAAEGECKSRRDRMTKMDVVGKDKRLTEIFLAIVKELAIREGVTLEEAIAA